MSEDQDFIRAAGPAFTAHLLRRLSDELVEAAKHWYEECGIEAPPRTTSTLLALDERGALGVTELAALLSQSHQLVLQWVRRLRELGLVRSTTDRADGRRTIIALTARGRAEVAKLRAALAASEAATVEWLDEAGTRLHEALWALERGARERPFIDRIRKAARATD